MKTVAVQAEIRQWLARVRVWWRHLFRREQPCLPAPIPIPFFPIVWSPTIRFIRLEQECSDAEIVTRLLVLGLRPVEAEELETEISRSSSHCPDGRILALGAATNDVRVVFIRSATGTVNWFWFPRGDYKHQVGDFAAARPR